MKYRHEIIRPGYQLNYKITAKVYIKLTRLGYYKLFSNSRIFDYLNKELKLV